jgi:serine/threonine protein kinase
MQPERWRQISGIFKSALALEPEERGAFVAAQCGPDEALRRDVERLISSYSQADQDNFMDQPAVAAVAPLLNSDDDISKDRLASGQQLSHYRILRKLGAGGMGEVYLAEDTQLDRTVALKILPADVAADKRRMQRFKQEAKLASSLNQPNILTIFEFGEAGSLHFIASEYVDGATLRDQLRLKPIKLAEVIEIGTQVVAALDAAHEAKIVHRDIKPENIMLRRRDGVVKVLDFGLAKLSEPPASAGGHSDTEANTELLLRTTPGTVMGTVSYMSPEQAQGLRVDERTDLWSTGIVIYEMVAGRLPFAGTTSSHLIVEILEKEPALFGETGIGVPPELERIVAKALAKNPDERYQTAKDLLIDLRNLKRRIDLDAEIKRSVSTHLGTATTDGPAASDLDTAATQNSTRNGSADRGPTRLKLLPLAALLVVLIAALLALTSWSRIRLGAGSPPPAVIVPSARQLSYWMTVQKYRAGRPFAAPFRLAGEINFEPNYQVKLNITSPQAGYLYILNEGPRDAAGSSSFVVLFPSPTANDGLAYLGENQRVEIPPQSWFQFDAEEGTEKLWLVFSAQAVTELELVKQFANPKDRGQVKDAELQMRVQDFLLAHAKPVPALSRDDELKQTTLSSPSAVLVYSLKLEHH